MLLPKMMWIICRVCLKQNERMHNIFKKISSYNIWLLLRDCGGVPVRQDDNLPDKICNKCLLKLWDSYKFRLESQRGYREITQILLNRSYDIYEQELEAERKACSDIDQTSIKFNEDLIEPINDLSNIECTPSNDQVPETVKKSPENPKFINQNEDMPVESDQIESIKPEEIETIEIANGSTKHYCIVKQKYEVKVEDKVRDNDGSVKRAEQKRIVLLFKLKNTIPKTKTETKTKSITQTKSKTKPQCKTRTNKNKITRSRLTCKICKKKFTSVQLLRHHNYTHQKSHSCNICGKTFSQSQSYLNHYNSHTRKTPFNCRICNKKFSDVTNRNTHERLIHKAENKEFKCRKCDKKFRFLSMLEKHSNAHKLPKCKICGKVLATLQTLRSHQQRKHLKKTIA